MKSLYLLTIFSAFGCAHYTLTTQSPSVFIPPFSVDAAYDIDAAGLANAMVSDLENEGIRASRVKKNNSDSLSCFLTSIHTRTNATTLNEHHIRCALEEHIFERSLASGVSTHRHYRHTETQHVLYSSARETVSLLAPEIAKYIRER